MWEGADSVTAAMLAALPGRTASVSAMDTRRQPPLDQPSPADTLSAEARGLFAAGWYATRDEGRLVHPAEQTEQMVSPETWRALRELGSSAPVRLVPQD